MRIVAILWLPTVLAVLCGHGSCNAGVCSCQECPLEDQVCFCDIGWDGDFCECNCFKHGTCVNDTRTPGMLRCECYEHHFGPNCRDYCFRNTTCSGRGNCTAEGRCDCDAGWTGNNCEKTTICDACQAALHGICSNGTFCECSDGRQGESCNCSPRLDCFGRGMCNTSSSTPDCLCDDGFEGEHCEIDHCSTLTSCAKCILSTNCTWKVGACARSTDPKGNACVLEVKEDQTRMSIWVLVGASVSFLLAVLGIILLVRCYRKFMENKKQAASQLLHSRPQRPHPNIQGGPSSNNVWFSETPATEEYVYLDDNGDDSTPRT